MKKLNNVFSRSKPLNYEEQNKMIQKVKEDGNTEKGKVDEEIEENNLPEEEEVEDDSQRENQVGLSLCKSLISVDMTDEDLISVFDDNKIEFGSFTKFSREYLTHPELMVRIHDSLYLPEDGIPQIISLLAYNRVLDPQKDEEQDSELEPQELQKENQNDKKM